jgi:hypothetical protein
MIVLNLIRSLIMNFMLVRNLMFFAFNILSKLHHAIFFKRLVTVASYPNMSEVSIIDICTKLSVMLEVGNSVPDHLIRVLPRRSVWEKEMSSMFVKCCYF